MIFLELKTLTALKNSYIPFLKEGGLFIPQNLHVDLGDKIPLTLMLLDEMTPYQLVTAVIWLPANDITDPFSKGIGVEFCDASSNLRSKIETYLVLKRN